MLKHYNQTNTLSKPAYFVQWWVERPILLGSFATATLSGMFAILTFLVLRYKTLSIDAKLEYALTTGKITKFDTVFDYLGDPKVIGLIILPLVLFFLWKKYFWAMLLLVTSGVGGTFLAESLKHVFKRKPIYIPGYEHFYSYPSGHATATICVLGALIYICFFSLHSKWKWILSGILLVPMIVLPISLVYYNMHYPTDVLGGLLFGGAFLTFLITLHQLYLKRELAKSEATKNKRAGL